MRLRPRRLQRIRHDSSNGQWELVRATPDARLQPWVHAYHGYVETSAIPVRRRELPSSNVPLIINFGAPFRVADPHVPGNVTSRHSFTAGLHDSYTLTESTGPAYCVQVDFTPIGAHLFLGLAMHTISHQEVDLHDALGPFADELITRLYELPNWESRFDLLDATIARRITNAPPPSPQVQWAWSALAKPGGVPSIGALADEVGWSRKHLIARFRDYIGLTPGTAARVLRFERVMRQIEGTVDIHWTDVAHAAGYYDQAHFIHEFRRFTGSTPGEYLNLRLLDGTGVIDR